MVSSPDTAQPAPAGDARPAPVEILGCTSAAVLENAHRLTRGAGAAAEVYRVAMREGVLAPERHGLSAAACEAWRDAFAVTLPSVERQHEEPTEHGALVTKLVLRAADGARFEAVSIPIGDRWTSLCVSTQVGCRMACGFCETARMGRIRNLSAAEIVSQVVVARRQVAAPRSVVFMGMGEALDNFDALAAALDALTDRRGLAYAWDKITVCTVGHVDGIRRLAALGHKRLNLSVSLNSADDSTRRKLMPVAGGDWPLDELQRALVDYRQRPNFQLGVHYCVMPGLNDTRADARAVAAFCAPLGRVMVQVIPYNPGSVPLTRAPDDAEVDRFIGWLREEGLPVRRRITKGRSVMAACGQLGEARVRQSRP